MFVWARGFCGTRICCCASVDCSGTTGKIHMRKIGLSQGVARAYKSDGFHDPGTFDEAPETVQGSGVRAASVLRDGRTAPLALHVSPKDMAVSS